MGVYYGAVCHAEKKKLVHCLKCQGHSKGLYNYKIKLGLLGKVNFELF